MWGRSPPGYYPRCWAEHELLPCTPAVGISGVPQPSLMVPHHQGAIDMAMLVPDRAAHQELKDLADSITASQSDEIAKMNSWLAAWYGL